MNAPKSPIYYTVNVFNDGRFVMAQDFSSHFDAVRESVEWQEAGSTTEILELSHADLFSTSPDNYNPDVERVAY